MTAKDCKCGRFCSELLCSVGFCCCCLCVFGCLVVWFVFVVVPVWLFRFFCCWWWCFVCFVLFCFHFFHTCYTQFPFSLLETHTFTFIMRKKKFAHVTCLLTCSSNNDFQMHSGPWWQHFS